MTTIDQAKQAIEEMAKVVKSSLDGLGCGNFNFTGDEISIMFAKALYNANYRKQSERYLVKENGDIVPLTAPTEWFSVEERLPKVDTDVLVITANGSFKVGRCNIYHNGTLVLWMTNDGLGEKAITHWMPLPEPPRRKGGEG